MVFVLLFAYFRSVFFFMAETEAKTEKMGRLSPRCVCDCMYVCVQTCRYTLRMLL